MMVKGLSDSCCLVRWDNESVHEAAGGAKRKSASNFQPTYPGIRVASGISGPKGCPPSPLRGVIVVMAVPVEFSAVARASPSKAPSIRVKPISAAGIFM